MTRLDDGQLADVIVNGKPATGMPAFQLDDPQVGRLVSFLRTLRDPESQRPAIRMNVELSDGTSLVGEVINRSADDLQLRTEDGRIALLRVDGQRYRRVTSDVDWTTYNGDVSANRYSELEQINADTIGRLTTR